MEIISINSFADHHARLSEQLGIALTNDIGYLGDIMDQEFLFDGVIFVMIDSGRISLNIEAEECHLDQGEVGIVNYGHRISDVIISPSFKFRAFFISRESYEAMNSRLELNWSLRSGIFLFSHLKYQPENEEYSILNHYYDLLDTKLRQTRQQQQGIEALSKAFGYEMLDQMEHHNFINRNSDTTDSGNQNASQHHFYTFMNLLVTAKVVDRTVVHYADRLRVSPKYLNHICRLIANQSPSELIANEILQRATQLLRENSQSIKEIAHQLGFCNQSQFGTFMRRVAGKSPLQIRNHVSLENEEDMKR